MRIGTIRHETAGGGRARNENRRKTPFSLFKLQIYGIIEVFPEQKRKELPYES